MALIYSGLERASGYRRDRAFDAETVFDVEKCAVRRANDVCAQGLKTARARNPESRCAGRRSHRRKLDLLDAQQELPMPDRGLSNEPLGAAVRDIRERAEFIRHHESPFNDN